MSVLLTIVFLGGLLILAAGAYWAATAGRSDNPGASRFAGISAGIVGAILALLTCFSTVDARAVGIQTSFGKYRDTLSSGFQWTAPWSSVEEWTTRNQTLRFAGAKDDDDTANYVTQPQITVRLGSQSIAYVDLTATWVVGEDTKGIEGLWRQYKTFEDMRHDFVLPTALGAVNTAFDGYNPFLGLEAGSADKAYVPLAVWSSKIADVLKPLYASRGITLLNVQATQVHYDPQTEGKLKEYATAVANTRIAAQNVETAKKDAEASAARKAQSGGDCISLIRDLAAQDQLRNLPPGTSLCGGAGTPVIVGK
jgi:regulator of protease activity HflC (stomatin/prohibitin superfamily)